MKYRIVVDGAVFSTACCLALARRAARASDGSPAEQDRPWLPDREDGRRGLIRGRFVRAWTDLIRSIRGGSTGARELGTWEWVVQLVCKLHAQLHVVFFSILVQFCRSHRGGAAVIAMVSVDTNG